MPETINTGEKLIYSITRGKDITPAGALISFAGCYVVRIDGYPEECFENPIIAWGKLIETVDVMVRKRIGDMLDKQGKSRYTGEYVEMEDISDDT